MIDPKNHLILALDVVDFERAALIAQSVAKYVDAIKVHWPIILTRGLGGIRGLSRLAPVIADLKLSDIPYTNRVASEMVFSSGASGIICQGFVGDDSVKGCMEAGGDVFVLVEMSHPGSKRFLSGHSEEIASMARDLGVAGIVAPGNRPERLRRYRQIVGQSLKILSPGIGAQGGSPGDAVAAGADFEIVGRAIYRSADPADAAKGITEAIAEKA